MLASRVYDGPRSYIVCSEELSFLSLLWILEVVSILFFEYKKGR